jgi:hypothetical protein
MNVRTYFIILTFILCGSSGITYAATGSCDKERDMIEKKSWDAIRYKYSPRYIEDNRAEFEKAVKEKAEVIFKECEIKILEDARRSIDDSARDIFRHLPF